MKKSIENIITFVKPEFVHKDDRGTLRQLVSEGWTQVNINTSVAGSFRGNHHHKNNREMFFIISGGFKLDLDNNGQKFSFEMEEEDFFIIEPNVSHSFTFTKDTLLIALYDKGVIEEKGENQKIDIYQNG